MVDNSNFSSNQVAGLGDVSDKSLTSSHKSEFCLMLLYKPFMVQGGAVMNHGNCTVNSTNFTSNQASTGVSQEATTGIITASTNQFCVLTTMVYIPTGGRSYQQQ
jgi:hypothetical protein